MLLLLITIIQCGDYLHARVSTRVPHLSTLVGVVVELVANGDHLGKNSIEEVPLRNICAGKEPNTAAVLAIRHPVDGISRLLARTLPQPVGDTDLLPAETNNSVLRKHLTTATLVLLTAAATIAPSRPNNLQHHVHRTDGRDCGAVIWRTAIDRALSQQGGPTERGNGRIDDRRFFRDLLRRLQRPRGRSDIHRRALQRSGRRAHLAHIHPPRIFSVGARAALPELRGIGGIGGHGEWLCCELRALTYLFYV